jgi:hypothetical protein
MKAIWKFLQGKKTSIATISGAILVYLLNNGTIDGDTAQLISVILAGLGLTANTGSYVANRMAEKKTKALNE